MNNIRFYRKLKGLTLKQLGNIVGVAESTISKYENGVNEPDIKTFQAIAETLGVSMDELVNERNEPFVLQKQRKDEKDRKLRTTEAKIISAGIDRMPEKARERALEIMKLAFVEFADFFEEENDDDT